jgi:hypothetical protein
MKPLKTMTLMALLLSAVLLAGCAATYTSMRYNELKVENKMSASIFLDPVAPRKRTVYVQVRNTSDKNFFLQQDVVNAIKAKGYRVVDDPTRANYLLQANVLSVGQVDEAALEKAQAGAFGGPLAGAAIGGLIAGSGNRVGGAIIGGLVGGAAEMVSGAAVKVITFAVITDLQISERAKGAVSESFDSSLKQGTGDTHLEQTGNGSTQWKRYRTRIVSSARRTGLTFEEAYPHLRSGIARSISGVL